MPRQASCPCPQHCCWPPTPSTSPPTTSLSSLARAACLYGTAHALSPRLAATTFLTWHLAASYLRLYGTTPPFGRPHSTPSRLGDLASRLRARLPASTSSQRARPNPAQPYSLLITTGRLLHHATTFDMGFFGFRLGSRPLPMMEGWEGLCNMYQQKHRERRHL